MNNEIRTELLAAITSVFENTKASFIYTKDIELHVTNGAMSVFDGIQAAQ